MGTSRLPPGAQSGHRTPPPSHRDRRDMSVSRQSEGGRQQHKNATCYAPVAPDDRRHRERHCAHELLQGVPDGRRQQLCEVEPQSYLQDVITRIVNGHANNQIDELLPWAYAADANLADVA